MQTRLLTPDEFHATRINPVRVTDGTPPLNFWDYVAAIPAADFGIADCRAGQVTHVYRMEDRYEHILINSQYQGVAMVIVVGVPAGGGFGKMLLDLTPAGTEEPG